MPLGKSVTHRNFLKKKEVIFLLSSFFVLFLVVVSLGLSFRKTRDLLPPTEIGPQKIVGYTQYFGYPFYLDTIIFFVFICSPFISIILFFAINKLRQKGVMKYDKKT